MACNSSLRNIAVNCDAHGSILRKLTTVIILQFDSWHLSFVSTAMRFCAAPVVKSSSSAFVQRLSTAKRIPYPQPRRCPPVSATSSGPIKVELEAMARDILEKENELKNAFQPGRPMPTVPPISIARA